jgi:hypothetical protein
MKTLTNFTLTTSSGDSLKDAATDEDLNTVRLIQAVFNNVKYDSRAEQRQADKVYEKISSNLTAEQFELEDAEFDLVCKYANSFPPFLEGRKFIPFFEELDRASTA